jgi:hypothetical protein
MAAINTPPTHNREPYDTLLYCPTACPYRSVCGTGADLLTLTYCRVRLRSRLPILLTYLPVAASACDHACDACSAGGAPVAMADSPWEESLVLLCGPPCTGKTAVARQHADYRRLSFDSCCENQSGTHRSKSRLVKKKLANNGRVCLDDQHLESSLRKNLVNWTVKDLAPPQQALCVWCEPEGGRTQCIWANEWNMVAALEAGAARSEYMPLALSVQRSDEAYGGKHKRSLEPWFPSGSAVVPKPPSEADLLAEGFRRVLAMPRLPLCPELHGTFHRAGLVIDAHAVLEDRSPSGGRAPPLVRGRGRGEGEGEGEGEGLGLGLGLGVRGKG